MLRLNERMGTNGKRSAHQFCGVVHYHRANLGGRPLELLEWHTLLKMACVYSCQEAESRTRRSGVHTSKKPGHRNATSPGAKREQACALQARVPLRSDEVWGQAHGELDKGNRPRNQYECPRHLALASCYTEQRAGGRDSGLPKGEDKAAHYTGRSVLDSPHFSWCSRHDIPGGDAALLCPSCSELTATDSLEFHDSPLLFVNAPNTVSPDAYFRYHQHQAFLTSS